MPKTITSQAQPAFICSNSAMLTEELSAKSEFIYAFQSSIQEPCQIKDEALCNNSQQQFPNISYFMSQRAPS